VQVTGNEIVTRTSAGILAYITCGTVWKWIFVLLPTVCHIRWGSGLWEKPQTGLRATENLKKKKAAKINSFSIQRCLPI